MPRKIQIRRLVKDIFGYPDLRPGQEVAIRAILDGYKTLAVEVVMGQQLLTLV